MEETLGLDIGLYVDIEGTMTLVAARRGLDWEETADAVDASHADNFGWATKIYGQQDWNATLDGVLLIDHATGDIDASLAALKAAKRAREEITVQKRRPGGAMEEAPAIINSISETSDFDDVVTYSIGLEGAGEPEEGTYTEPA